MSRRPPLAVALAVVFVLVATTGCVTEVVGEDVEAAVPGETYGVVVGDLDWVEAPSLADADPRRVASRSVAYLWVPQMGYRCTAFLIDDDVIATARHCVPDAAAARGASASFTYELGATSYGQVYCGTFLGADATLDAALLRCDRAPGFAPLAFVDTAPAADDPLYLVHQNCDYYRWGTCEPNKKVSPGKAVGVEGKWLYHDADMLPGSSGGPLIDAALHAVVGINTGQQPQNIGGRGSFNVGTPSSQLRAFVDGADVDATWISPPPGGATAPPPPASDDDVAPTITKPASGAHVTTEHVDLACTAVAGASEYRFALEYERAPDDFAAYHTWTTTTPSKRVWPVRTGVRYRLRASADGAASAPILFTFR